MRRYLPLALVAALLSVSLALAVSDVFPARMPRPTPEQYPTVLTGPGAAWDLTTATVGTGTIALTPSGGRYVHGTTVSCAATGDVNNRFSGWSGDLSGSTTPQNLVMTAAKSITATFIPQWDIAVTTVGTGTVTSDPAGSPAWTYDDGTAVTLTAAAQTGYEFTSWSVDTTVASDSTLAIAALHADKNFTATFTQKFYGLSFDGGDYASMTNETSAGAFDVGTGSFTVEAYVYLTTLEGSQTIFDKRDGSVRVLFFVSGTSIRLNLADGVNPDVDCIGATTLATDTWYHVAGTLDRTDKKSRVYINGNLDQTSSAYTTFGSLTSTGSASLGVYAVDGTPAGYLSGKLASFRFSIATAKTDFSDRLTPFATGNGITYASEFTPGSGASATPYVGTPAFTLANTPATPAWLSPALTTLPPTW